MPVANFFSVLNKLLARITDIDSSLSHRHDVRDMIRPKEVRGSNSPR